MRIIEQVLADLKLPDWKVQREVKDSKYKIAKSVYHFSRPGTRYSLNSRYNPTKIQEVWVENVSREVLEDVLLDATHDEVRELLAALERIHRETSERITAQYQEAMDKRVKAVFPNCE